ncbi:RNA polymerase sigma factor [Geodermatophilus nigrescens]|uniref:RNA polymerase sigma factor n=1 Tax=Geodermatophilus sp. FMUSA9-8 TaxID=3120155 RepID=UPI00300B0585
MEPEADGDDAVAALVARALAGDSSAWDRLVERFTPLVLSIVRRNRLQDAEAQDVVQTVWLRLVEHLGAVREPRALPGWIATTARNECSHVTRGRPPVPSADLDAHGPADGSPGPDRDLLEGERHEALLAALSELPERQRRLLLLLIEDPPVPYEEVSRRLGMPIGSIGPTRARAIARIRAHAAVRALLEV